ncbi:copper resistance protein NlpE [Flavobacterium hauense]
MKLLQITCLSLLMATAIGCKEEKRPEALNNEILPKEVVDSVDNENAAVGTAHNSANSLDWAGAYSGVSPCADCPGIKTDITLANDNTYSLQEQYLEKEKTPRTFKGTFSWDEAESVITLDADGDHHKFKVMEGKLRMLDKFGDPKQGGKPEDFDLKKVR